MKHMSVKKIVLCSIGLFSALMMLIGLAFNVITIDFGTYSGLAESAVNDTLGGSANGFQLLSFSFPDLINTVLLLLYAEGDVSGFAVLFGIISLITLLLAIAELILFVYVLFWGSLKKWNKYLQTTIIVNVIIVAVYAIIGIVMTCIWNSVLNDVLESLSYTSYAYSFGMSYMWVSIIFQALALAAYIVCSIKIELKGDEIIIESKPEKAEKTDGSQLDTLRNIFKEEQEIIEVLKEYKKLCDNSIITSADFFAKKAKLLQYTETNIKTKLLRVQDQFNFGVGEAEKMTLELLKQYKELMDEDVLTSMEFLQKKDSLLVYIVH